MLPYKFNYDYSKTMWMKMFLASPDFENNTSNVRINFEQALDIIKTVDNLTQGITKIIYMVGWQGLGHDDCYPEMEVVNRFLKRDCDATARDSFLWLFEEAKKYHTVVSVHGNQSDEYGTNASHKEIVDANAVVMNPDGTPAVIETFYGRDAYKISYKQYWESGLFKKYWDRFCEVIPVKEAGTVHLDNFCIAESFCPRTTVEEQDEARNAILDYIRSQGIDVTSEYTYRETEYRCDYLDHPIRNFYAKHVGELPKTEARSHLRTLGRIPATWWTDRLTMDDLMENPASLLSGHFTDKNHGDVFYGSMHGEDIWIHCGTDREKWVPLFIREFCTQQVPYFYLNRYDRLSYKSLSEEEGGGFEVTFSDGVISRACDHSITKNGALLKQEEDIMLPLDEENTVYIAYSHNGRRGKWNMPDAAFTRGEVCEITADGNRYIGTCEVVGGAVELEIKAGQGIVIKAV